MQPIDRAYLRLTKLVAFFVGLALIIGLAGCATPTNHQLLCQNPYIEIDISAAWLCYPKFNREDIADVIQTP